MLPHTQLLFEDLFYNLFMSQDTWVVNPSALSTLSRLRVLAATSSNGRSNSINGGTSPASGLRIGIISNSDDRTEAVLKGDLLTH